MAQNHTNVCLTLPQAAEFLCVSYSTAKRLAVAKKLPGAFRLGGLWRVNKAALDQASMTPGSSPDAAQPAAI